MSTNINDRTNFFFKQEGLFKEENKSTKKAEGERVQQDGGKMCWIVLGS